MAIKNIIFDYGNVIFTIDFKKAQHSFSVLGINNVEQFFAHAGHDALFDEFEKGHITATDFRNGIRRITETPTLIDEEIDRAWNTLLIGVPPGNHEVLLQAKRRYRTFLLSNNNEIHYEWIMDYLKREYRVTSNAVFFEKDYYSHLMGMRKPDRNIFDYVLSEHDLMPEETLFIDDSPQHIKTAQSIGLKTHLMTSDDSLQKYMSRSGLLS